MAIADELPAQTVVMESHLAEILWSHNRVVAG